MNRFWLLLCIAIGLGAGGLCAKTALVLPPPVKCNRLQLTRWLVSRDITRETQKVQLQLISRLQSELMAGWRTDAAPDLLSTEQRNQLASNIQELKYQWFVTRCSEFDKTRPTDSTRFLDKQIAFVRQMQSLSINPTNASLGSELDGWRSRVPEVQRSAVDQTVKAAFVRWLQTERIDSLPTPSLVELAERIASHLDTNQKSSAVASAIPAAVPDNDVWRANVDSLMSVWFQTQADTCDRLPVRERPEFAANVLDRIRGWDLNSLLDNNESPMALGALSAKVSRWKSLASQEDSARLDRFQTQMQQALLADFIRQGRAFFR